MKQHRDPHQREIVIVSGGSPDADIATVLAQADYIIGADRGAAVILALGYTPDLALGDFDSVHEWERDHIQTSSHHYIGCDAIDKNYTDTELAFLAALEHQATSITLCAGTGTRLDHTLANIHLLKRALELQIDMRIIDGHNCIRLADRQLTVKKEHYTYLSLLPLSLEVHGINLIGFQYPLHDASLVIGQSLGISNKWIAEEGSVSIREGLLLVICSND
ncbi:thiamine diphosphokinase [Paenibacillus sp. ACRRX]|uniref:thiamine diphosphokinase n=1 Tax=Paenibacillus sp. ACRRX TaxID=2918206 RepID=UPI001EF3F385|nr:thiamine diphosphokinase [Paenibacillus sp. ACRRX]MCG7407144.1 thiamine diphosphokinase [Paenibacillus sp. ACRRX]